MVFVDLCVAAAFDLSYAVERCVVGRAGAASPECRALTRLFRKARVVQPHSLAEIRRAMRRPLLRYVGRPHPAASAVSVERIGGVICHRIAGPDPICVVHGGGFVGGTWKGYAGYCAAIAAISGRGILFVDYDIEAPHREQVAQIAAVITRETPTVAVADSAGGHLLLCAYEDTGAAAGRTVLFSPVTDPGCMSDSFRHNGWCYVHNICDHGNPVGEAMLHPTVTATLLQSVTTRKIRKVPDGTVVFASENELFADDARRLQVLGATVTLSPATPGGVFHAWPLWDIPEADATLRAAFLPDGAPT